MKRKIRVLALVLALVLIASALFASFAMFASADEAYVCEIGGVGYTSVEEAIEAANAGDMITLLADVGTVTLTKAITLNTAGFAATVEAGSGITLQQIGKYYKAYDSATYKYTSFADMESLAIQNTNTASYATGKNFAVGGNTTFVNVNNNEGIVYVEEANGNKYIKYDWQQRPSNVSAKNPYLLGTFTSTAGDTVSHAYFDAYVIDLDINLPKGRVVDGTSFAFSQRNYDAVNKKNITTGTPNVGVNFYYDTTSQMTYLASSKDATTKFYIDSEGWNHITMVLTADTDGAGAHTLNLYLYINGKYAGLAASNTNSLATATITDFRFGCTNTTGTLADVPGEAEDTGVAELCYDNVYARSFKKEYDRTDLENVIASKADITEWRDNTYFADNVPAVGETVAKIGDKSYDGVQKAILDAQPGDVITLCKNVGNIYLDKTGVTIDKAGYTTGTVYAASGLRVDTFDDVVKAFDSATVKSYGIAVYDGLADYTQSAAGGKTYEGYYFDHKGPDSGTYYIESNAAGDNKYFRYDWNDINTAAAVKNPYILRRFVSVASDTASAEDSHANYSVYTLDFDMYLPTGKVADGTNFFFYQRYLNGTTTTNSNQNLVGKFYYDETSGRNYLTDTTNSKRVWLDSDSWNHITAVVVSDIVDGTTTVKLHMYLNGEYVGLFQTTTTTEATMTVTSARMQFIDTLNNEVVTGNAEIAIDNYTQRRFTRSYDRANLDDVIERGADITEWHDHVYFENSVPSTGKTVAKIGEVGYESVAKALDAAKAGDVIELVDNVKYLYITKTGVTIDKAGFTVVGSVSAASGLTVKTYGEMCKAFDSATLADRGFLDFESLNIQTHTTTGNLNLGNGYSFAHNGGSASGTAYIEAGASGGKQFRYDWADTIATVANPYFLNRYNGSNDNPSAENSHANYSVYTLDFDMYLPTGKLADGTNFFFFHRYEKSAGSYANVNGRNLVGKFIYDEASGRNYLTDNSNTKRVWLDSDLWNHITAVVVSDIVDGTTTVKLHMYLNGEYVGLFQTETTTEATATITGVRMQFIDTKDNEAVTGNAEIAIDNYTQRRFTRSYDKTNLNDVIKRGADITEWHDHVYFEKNVPFGNPVAQNGEKIYDSLQKAIDEAAEGDTITLLKSTNATVTVAKELTFETGEFTVGGVMAAVGYAVEEGAGYIVINNVEGKYFSYVKGGRRYYTTDIATAFANADNDSTVTLIADVAIEGRTDGDGSLHELFSTVTIAADKTVRFDLAGHILRLSQNEQNPLFNFAENTTLYITDSVGGGALMAARSNYNNATFPMLYVANNSGVEIYIEDVDTYGCLVYNYKTTTKVEIRGGKHYGINSSQGTIGNAIITSAGVLDFYAEDALFFVDESTTVISSVARYRTDDNVADSTIEFDGCTLIADPTETTTKGNNLIAYADEYTKITFVGCSILGSINPSTYTDNYKGAGTTANPTDKWGPVGAGAITFGEGTKYAADYTMIDGGVIVYPDGFKAYNTADVNSYELRDCADNVYESGFALTAKNIEVTYNKVVTTQIDEKFSYTYGGIEIITDNIVTAINGADDGTAVKLLKDVELTSAVQPIATFSGVSILDLNGFTFTLYQSGQACFYVSGDFTLTDSSDAKTGVIRAVRTDDLHTDGNSYADTTYPVFVVSGGNTTVRLYDAVAYGSTLVASWQGNTNVIVRGGKYHATQPTQGGWGGIFDLRHNSTIDAKDAFFFFDASSWLITAASRYSQGVNPSGVYTFENCKIISDPDDSGAVIKYANEFTRFYFYDCDILGDINPSVHGSDVTYANGAYTATKYGNMKPGSIVLGRGTRFDATKTLIGGGVIVAEDGYVFVTEASEGGYHVTDVEDKPFTNGYSYTERDLTASFTRQVATNGLAYTYSYYNNGAIVYTNDFLEAIKTDSNTTVTLHKDDVVYSDTNGEFAQLKSNMTFDLGGHVFSVVQGHQAYMGVRANITIKNGELRVVCDDTLAGGTNYVDKSFPLFTMFGNKTLSLVDLNVYASSLVISRANNVTVNITGGQYHITHHMTQGYRGSWGGMFDMRGRSTVNITDAIIFTDRSNWIVTSASSYVNPELSAAERESVFTFTNCTLISDPTDAAAFSKDDLTYGHLVKYANENTKLYFNNCNILGSVNPIAFSTDYKSGDGSNKELGNWAAIPAENIILGEGTRIATSHSGITYTFMGYTFDGATLGLIDEEAKLGFVLKTCNDKPYTDGYKFTTQTYFYVFDKVVADTVNITITFHNPDGTTFTETYQNGEVIDSLPEYAVPEAVENGWVKITYAGGWSLTAYGERIDSLTVTGRLHLWPAATEAKAYLTSGMYNLSLYGNVGANILIPDIDYRPEGIILIGVYDMDGNEIDLFASGLAAKGMTYSSYEAGRTGVTQLDSPVKVQVKYTYYNVEFTQTITVNPLNYVKFALTSGATNPDAKTLLADMIVYADAINKYNKKDNNAILAAFDEVVASGKTLYDLANEFKSTLADESVFDNAGDFENYENEYVEAIMFNVGGADPSFVVTFKDGVRVVDVKFVMKDVYINDRPGYDKGNVTYGTDTEGSTYVDDTDVLSMAHSEGISVYNLALGNVELILTVLDDNGGRHTVQCEGRYNIANYYGGIAAGGSFTEADIARAKGILTALYTYGTSSAAYRFGEQNTGDGEMESNIKNIYYEDFGAEGDGVTDDFAAIQAAHAEANSLKDQGFDVTVYAVKPGSAATTFLLKNTDPAAPTYGTYIEVRTDVIWTGASFIFDDSDLNNDNYKTAAANGRTAFGTPFFRVMPDYVSGTNPYYAEMRDYTDNGGQLLKTDTHIESIKTLSLPFEWALVRVYNSQHVHYVRYGANAGSTIQQEIILVNTRTGEIDPSTPVVHDYLDVYSLRFYDASAEPITIKGGNITTRYNQVDSYDYSARGIQIVRSNTTITGLENRFEYSDWNNSSPTHGSPMNFIRFEYTHGVTIDDCLLEGPMVFYDQINDSGVGVIMRGSYTICGDYNSSLKISKITQRNLYRELNDPSRGKTPDGMMDHQAVMGSNYCKNVLFENNKMSTYDAHTGLYNLVVRGCEVERINVIGSGTVVIEDTVIHTGVTHAAITLREDYNSNFKGDVYFKNVTLETYDTGYVGLFWMTSRNYNTGLYYADGETFTVNDETRTNKYYAQDTVKDGNDEHYYSAYLPENVYIDGLTIRKGGSITTDESLYLGGTYTPGTEAGTSVKLALYNGYSISQSKEEQILMPHRWGCDISTYGASFTDSDGLFGSTLGGTKYTVKHPIKPTEKVYIDADTKAKYTLNDYVYLNELFNDLAFLDSLQVLTLE